MLRLKFGAKELSTSRNFYGSHKNTSQNFERTPKNTLKQNSEMRNIFKSLTLSVSCFFIDPAWLSGTYLIHINLKVHELFQLQGSQLAGAKKRNSCDKARWLSCNSIYGESRFQKT